MPRPLQPTVRQLPPIRQVIAGAAIAGAVAVAVPATASAGLSACHYDSLTRTMTIHDRSAESQLRVVRVGNQIRFADGNEGPRFCVIGPLAVATVDVVDTIEIERSGGRQNLSGGLNIDLRGGPFGPGFTPEGNGIPEIEIRVVQTGGEPNLHDNQLSVFGTPQRDEITLGVEGRMHFNSDADVDLSFNRKPEDYAIYGGEGDDLIRSTGVELSGKQAALLGVYIEGDGGNDVITGSVDREDMRGEAGDDRLYSVDDGINGDAVYGGEGGNDFAIVDKLDYVDGVESKFVTTGPIFGAAKLTPGAVKAKAGKPVRLRVGYTHHEAWKAVRAVRVRVFDATTPVGSVAIRPAGGRVAAHGAIKLAAGSKTGHEGTTVTADVRLKLPKALAGKRLTVDVEATDAKGRTQVEPVAAVISS